MTRLHRLLATAAAPAVGLLALGAVPAHRTPVALINESPSLPRGLYVRTPDPEIGRGAVVALRQPDVVRPYLSRRGMAWRERDIVAWNESRGAPLHPGPPRAPRAPARPPEDRRVPERVKPPPAAKDTSMAETRAKASGRKRKRPPVAEGQLGFDF
jgi:hypothetical protein